MTNISTLRREKTRLRKELRQLTADIAAGRRPSRAQVLNAIVIEANTNAEIQ